MSSTMKIWRVEHKDNRYGPYCFHNGPLPVCSGSEGDTPTPENDGIIVNKYPDEHRFGFASPKKLKDWFKLHDRINLADKNFVCRIYEVPAKEVIMGRKQVIFPSGKAKLVRKSKVIKSA